MELIQPIFVNQSGETYEAGLGPDNSSYSLKDINNKIQQDINEGGESFLLFVVPNKKTKNPDWKFNGEVVSQIKSKFGSKVELFTDICLCSTMTDGHCCVIDNPKKTEELLQNLASVYYKAGADSLAPSDMQPNTVKNIKQEFPKAHVTSYSTKFRSSFYKGFRQIADSSPSSKRFYQLDVSNAGAAIQSSIKYDKDGADFLMVKPAMTSLDLIDKIKMATHKPVGAFQVSGEYLGLADDDQLLETYKVMKRAEIDFLISYGARKLLKLL
ncbi:uncharacterized protein METZ01_LOCUS231926 [marine metagenome]|jgi:porphobilinogen synthase|uniref:porphobilinogen synthase n=1 Tax=marine metagenome TaxID=408172 RepID=A0A382GW19_9ZZZZ|tara:strand:+ start:52728 stop:53537 length:810 start_codon:yes stop_codon:yes gene_type:complete